MMLRARPAASSLAARVVVWFVEARGRSLGALCQWREGVVMLAETRVVRRMRSRERERERGDGIMVVVKRGVGWSWIER
jgi:hypothetical protein